MKETGSTLALLKMHTIKPLCFTAPVPICAGIWAGTSLNTKCVRPLSLSRKQIVSPTRRARTHATIVCAASATVISDRVVRLPSEDGRVDVTLRVEDVGGRTRRVSGGVDILQPAERVWNVLTHYENNADYIPNIVSSTVTRPNGKILLEQIGLLSNKLKLRTRLVMAVTEDLPNWTISFTKHECRDFAEFHGCYNIVQRTPLGCRLEYSVIARPRAIYPLSLVERKITKEVPGMLAAIRVESQFGNFISF